MTARDAVSSLSELTPAQATAVEVIATGGTHAEAAAAAGVARETVTRWLSSHPGTRAALGRLRCVIAESSTDDVLRVRSQALGVLSAHLEAVDPVTAKGLNAAIATLRAVPAPTVPPPAPAELMARQAISETQEHLMRAEQAELLEPLDLPAHRLMLEAAGVEPES
jgi:hypothetical protein